MRTMPAKEAAHESDSKLRAAYRTLVPMAIQEQILYIYRGVGRRTLKSELLKFLKMARDNFPVGTIQLVTNGVKLLD